MVADAIVLLSVFNHHLFRSSAGKFNRKNNIENEIFHRFGCCLRRYRHVTGKEIDNKSSFVWTKSKDFQFGNFQMPFHVQSLSLEERKAMEKKILEECKTKEGATDADVSSIMAREMPTTQTAKCLNACMVETVGLVKDGKPSPEGAVELAKMAYDGDERAMSFAKDIGTDCAHIEDGDRCELAFKMMQCGQAAMTKRGLNPKDML